MSKQSKLLTEVPVYDKIPQGWQSIKGATTAPRGYMWVSNNKSHFGGERKQALVKSPGGDKRKGGKTMAKKDGATQYSAQDKCDYYSKRANDGKLSQKQREYAQKRLNQLCGGKTSSKPRTTGVRYTEAQKQAYNAGRVYGMAKTGKRVPVKDENKASFRAGVIRERSKNKPYVY